MSTSLRPLTTAELLDRTFHLYRNNFVLFAGIATVAAIAIVVGLLFLTVLGISLPTQGSEFDPRAFLARLALVMLVLALFYMLGSSLATGATIYAVSKVNLGQPVRISECYRKVFPRFGRIIAISLQIMLRLLGILLLLYLCVFVLAFIVGMILAGAGGRGPLIVGYVIGFGAVIVVYVILARYYLQYSLAIQACVLENTRPTESINRSKVLTRDYLWRIFLIYLLMGVLGIALSYVLHLPGILLKNALFAALIWQFLATFIANTLSFPISNIATSLVYFDMRVRKEAFDLQLMMESVGENPNQAAAAPVG